MTSPNIPIVRVLPSGRELPIGVASDMDSAHRLLDTLAPRYAPGTLYVDCARTADDVRKDYRADRAFGWTADAHPMIESSGYGTDEYLRTIL